MPHDRCIVCGAPAIESHLSQAGVCQNCIAKRLGEARAQWEDKIGSIQKRFREGIRRLEPKDEED